MITTAIEALDERHPSQNLTLKERSLELRKALEYHRRRVTELKHSIKELQQKCKHVLRMKVKGETDTRVCSRCFATVKVKLIKKRKNNGTTKT